jgi:cytoskeletal protein CcmA (bactofilin family)
MGKKTKSHDSISTFLGPEAGVEGTLNFKGTIRLDGKLSGKIHSENGTLIVGEKAVIDADINVGIAVVMGAVNGTIHATERIEVYPPARIVGDIQSPIVSIEEGGLFNGKCIMRGPSSIPPQHAREPRKVAVAE